MDGPAEGETPHVTSDTRFSLSGMKIIAVDLVWGENNESSRIFSGWKLVCSHQRVCIPISSDRRVFLRCSDLHLLSCGCTGKLSSAGAAGLEYRRADTGHTGRRSCWHIGILVVLQGKPLLLWKSLESKQSPQEMLSPAWS